MTTQWETARIFISSTFEDMHAERDYLVKQVFPELREWCEQRKLNLVDIDLRWGVKEDDTQNKNVVEVCLKRIDDARPFFLCFLGQRRGWIPQAKDISSATLDAEAFPDLGASIGNASVTEMEIMHALTHPFHGSRPHKDQNPEYYEPVKYAFFYLREPSYLEEMPKDFPDIRKIYTNEGLFSQEEQSLANQQLKKWRKEEIPALCQQRGLPLRHYQARWNANASSPELLIPLASSSLISANQKNWQKRWAEAGIIAETTSIEDPVQIKKAQAYNQKRTRGRLTDFEINGNALKQIVLQDLKRAIAERFPNHAEIGETSDLQKELDQQEQFLQVCREGFISRGDDFKELNQYVQDGRRQAFILTAPGGVGKSTLLANWVEELRALNEGNQKTGIHYRFIGQSDRSSNANSLLYFLLREIKETTGKLEEPLPESPAQMRQELPKLLASIGKNGKTIIILDALNQLETGLADLSWIPWQLPENIKLIVSFKRGEASAEELLKRLEGQVSHLEVLPFTSLEDRKKLVKVYLSQYLKDLDEHHIETLIQSEGAGNPLFLKVALSELRVFGAFGNLGEKIKRDFGETPLSAFTGVLKRLEEDPAYSTLDPRQAVPLLFGLLAQARAGLSASELSHLIMRSLDLDENEQNFSSISDTVFLFFRQVRPFLAHRDGRFDFFYESFKLAVLQRYEALYGLQGWQLKLADYFEKLPTWKDKQNQVPTARKIAELPYHLAMSGQSSAFQNCLTDFDFLLAKVLGMGAPALLEDFKLRTSPTLHLDSQIADEMTLLERSINLSLQNLQFDPRLFAGQIIARLGDLKSPTIEKLLAQAGQWTDQTWIRPLTTHFNKPDSELKISYQASNHSMGDVLPTPDGKALIVLSQETEKPELTLKRIEAFTGKVIHQIALENSITHAHLALSSDGRKVVMATPKLLFVYHAETLALEQAYPINSIAVGVNSGFLRLSPDNLFAFVIEQEMVLQIRLQNGECVRQFKIGRGMLDLKFSPSGRLAAFCAGGLRQVETEGVFTKEDYYNYNNTDELYVLDMQSTAPPRLISAHALSDEFIFSADEEHLICVNESGRLETWQITEAKSLGALQALTNQQYEGVRQGKKYSEYQNPGVAKIVPSANREKALCSFGSSYMATLNIRDPNNISIENHLYSTGHTVKLQAAHGVYAVSLSQMELIVWNMESGKLVTRLKDNDTIRGFSIGHLGDKTVIYSKNAKNILRVWDISHPTESAQNQTSASIAENAEIFKMESHPMGESICISKMMSLQFFSVASKSAIREIRTSPPILMNAHYHPDGKRIVLVFIDGSIKVLSLQNYQPLKSLKLKHLQTSLNTSSLSPDGKWLLYGEENNGMRMISLESEDEFAFEETTPLDPAQLPPASDIVTVMALTPKGGGPHWGRSQIAVLPESQQALSFCYIPHIHKSNWTHEGTLDHTEEWMEIHDLQTGKFVKRSSKSSHHPVVLETKISKNGRSVFQLIARNEADARSSGFSFSLEKTGADLETKQIIPPRKNRIRDFSISPDEAFAALVTEDGSLEYVSMDTGEMITHFKGDSIFSCCLALEDGQTLCTGGEHGEVNFFRVENVLPAADVSPKLILEGLPEIANNWQCAVLKKNIPPAEGSPEKSKAPASGVLYAVPKPYTFNGHQAPAMAVAITSDGRLAVSGAWDKTVKVWEQGNAVERFTLEGHQAAVMGVAITAEGHLAISASIDKTLKVWDLQTGREKRTLTGHTERVNAVAVTPDGRLAVSGSHDQTMRVWHVENGIEMDRLIGHSAEIQCVAITADGRLAISGSGDQTLKVWDLGTMQEAFSLGLDNDNSWVHAVAITPDGRLAVSGSGDKLVRVWDLGSKREVYSLTGHHAGVHAVAISADGCLAVSGSEDKTLKVWDLRTGMELITLSGHGNQIPGVAITPDGRLVISCSFNGTIKVWDLKAEENEN